MEGLLYAIRHERNLKIHFVCAILALVACLVLNLPTDNVLWVLLAVTVVFMAEMINTAIEAVVNLLTASHSPFAKVAKDHPGLTRSIVEVSRARYGLQIDVEKLLGEG